MEPLYTEVMDFIERHRAHGSLSGDASAPAMRGYLLIVTCTCGVVFERWATPAEAAGDLVYTDLLTTEN